MNKERIGEVKIIDGERWYRQGYYDDGITHGYIFKDDEAYDNDWDAVCYIPEGAFHHAPKDADGFCIDLDCFTHNNLLDMCYGNRELCDYLYSILIWAYPDTYITEWSDDDIACFYSFVRVDAEVWWNDPDNGQSSGVYTVFGAPDEFNEYGEPVDPDSFGLDNIILIDNDVSEVEVPYTELTPIYK